jgi:hypothetical protein
MPSVNCTSPSTEYTSKPVLHVEARVKGDGDNIIIRTDIVGFSALCHPSWRGTYFDLDEGGDK